MIKTGSYMLSDPKRHFRDPQNTVLVITGPTGVGKTALVDSITSHLPSEVVNADIGQMYTPLTIGTAKPQWRTAAVPHHYFDVINEPRQQTVMSFRRDLEEELLPSIWSARRCPVIVGGSTLYIKSLFFPPFKVTGSMLAEANTTEATTEALYQQLQKLDPERAQQIHPSDRYRLQRAIAIWEQTGQLPSKFTPLFDPIAQHIIFVVLTRNRAELYQQIDERVKEMLTAGWVREVEQLLDTPWEAFLLDKKLIGYELLVAYLRGLDKTVSFDECISQIQQRVRNYAKRQLTFYRGLTKQLEPHKDTVKTIWLCATELSPEEIVHRVLHCMQ